MYYSDDPITSSEEDALGREIFVNNLANDINRWTGKGSLVLALYGPWGTGKSSVLNLLQKKIETDGLCEIILFDPWYFNSTEQLIQTFFAVVKDKTLAFASEDAKTKLNDSFTKYSTSLSQIISWEPTIELPGGFKINLSGLIKKKEKLNSPEKVRGDLRQAIGKIKRRFIVIIDNLDRLDSPELMLMFKLVRLCSDFPNFVFVLAFDHEQVRKLIKSQGVDPDFLEKIVQIDIELPLIDQDDIDRFIDENLQKLIKDQSLRLANDSWERFVQIYNKVVSNHVINNLRTAKRYLNSVSFTIPILREEVDFADFLILEVLKVFYPRIYSGLPSYKKDLTSFEITYGLDTMRKLRLEANNDIREWIAMEVLGKREAQVCEQLIGFLFPTLGAYFQNPVNPSIISRRDDYLANQRICVVEYFDMYFNFRIPKGKISSRTLNTIEDDLNNIDKERIQEVISLIVNEKERLSQLLRQLYYRVDNINLDGRIALITILGEFSKILEWKLLDSWNASGPLAARIIINCVERIENNLKILNTIKKVISTTESLPFASELTSRLLSNEKPIQIPQSEKEAVKTIMVNKLHKELIENKQNVFATYPSSYYLILTAWRSEQVLNERETATNYIYEQMYIDANVLPKILLANATFEIGPTKVYSYEFERLTNDYDVDKLYEILMKQGSTANYSPIEKEAIDAFKKFIIEKSTKIKGVSE
jgi:predicted KAP-like P-loop ATPase